jgi:hypothetical protein
MRGLFLDSLSATATTRAVPFRHCGDRTAVSTLRGWTLSGSMHINDAGNKRRYLGMAPREAPRQDCCQQLLLTPPAEKEVHTATATMGGKRGMLMWQKSNSWMWWQVSLEWGLHTKAVVCAVTQCGFLTDAMFQNTTHQPLKLLRYKNAKIKHSGLFYERG